MKAEVHELEPMSINGQDAQKDDLAHNGSGTQ